MRCPICGDVGEIEARRIHDTDWFIIDCPFCTLDPVPVQGVSS